MLVRHNITYTVSARVNTQGVQIGKVLEWRVGAYVGGGVYRGRLGGSFNSISRRNLP